MKPGSRLSRWAAAYRRVVEPTSDGLPRLRILLAFPALLLVAGAVLVALGINGTSSGAYWSSVGEGSDPRLLLGHPETIRSDEWNTGTSWTISQAQQGFPAENRTFPGGMDAALPYDLPRLEWDVAFRPHLLGYLMLDIDRGTAWRWWMTGLPLIAAVYVFGLMLAPRRPLVVAGIGVAFFFSPFFQWWYQSSTFWPATWALTTMAATVWILRSKRALSRWIWGVLVAYLTVVMAMGIYVPFIVPAAFVVVFFAIGFAIRRGREGLPFRTILFRMIPIVSAAVVAAGVMLLYLRAKAHTVDLFLATVYPAARLTPTGSGTPRLFLTTFGSSFGEFLRRAGGFLGSNSSEAASFFLVGVFLIPAAIWVAIRRKRSGGGLPWELLALLGVVALFLAFMFVPGWDPIAHLFFLDRVPPERMRMGLGLASIAILLVFVGQLDELNARTALVPTITGVAAFAVLQGGIAALKIHAGGLANLEGPAPFWWLYAIASAAALYLFARRRLLPAVGALLVATVPLSGLVNPVYVGVLDLRQTAIARDVIAQPRGDSWVGIGGPVVTATLVESGVRSYNGVQGAPSATMWKQIDPTDRYKNRWNRIGWVNWLIAPGAPVVTNPTLDAVVVTLDPCSSFAQKHVTKVLSDHPISNACLREVERDTTPQATYVIYDVVPG